MTSARLLIDTLRFAGAPPPDQLSAGWRVADVQGLDRVIAFEGCAIWLYRRLRQIGALESIEPRFGAWLSARAREETARNLLIEAESVALADVFQSIDTPAVFMKGAARRVSTDRYPMADARPTNDVDVLVPADRAHNVWRELRQRGYERTTPGGPPRPEHHHLPALWNERRVGVEVHTTHAQGVSSVESWRRLYERGIDVAHQGRRFRVPPATELLWNGAAHALRRPDVAFLLVLLFDAAVIWASGVPIDWAEVAGRIDAKEIVDTAATAAWLGAAAELAGAEHPAELGERIAAYDLERALRMRLAVMRRVNLPLGWRKALAWWTSEVARRP